MDRADVAVSEKFSQILRAYQIENEYGRTMKHGDTIEIDGSERIIGYTGRPYSSCLSDPGWRVDGYVECGFGKL